MWQLGDHEFLQAWKLLPRVTHLQDHRPFPREDRVVFHDHDHSYIVDGHRVRRSVTGILHEFSTPFDPPRAVASMKRGREWDAKRESMEQ